MRWLALPALLGACSSWDTGVPAGPDPERACLDTVAALTNAGVRCGEEGPRLYDQELADVANGDCKNVTSVRDETALRGTCLPSLAKESCDDVLAGTRDPSCDNQLIHQN